MQYDYGTINPATTSGSDLASLLNQFRDALNSGHGGTTAPAYATGGLCWIDTSASPIWILKMYDGAQWISLMSINTTTNQATAYSNGAALGTAATKDTGTAAGQIPLNSDLGDLAYLDALSTSSQIPNDFIQAAMIAANQVTTAKIAANNVTFAKLPAASASTLIGRRSGSGGDFEAVTLGAGLSMNTSGVLSTTATGVAVITKQIFTSSGTWTKPSNLLYVEVEVVGGGGTGAYQSGTVTFPTCGGGGGGGGFSKKLIAAGSLGSTETVTVGAAAGTSSFGAHCSATGGSNGVYAQAGSLDLGGAAGVGSGGDLNFPGSPGSPGVVSTSTLVITGKGGASGLGTGGAQAKRTTSGSSNGTAGTAPGGGGSGHGNASSGSSSNSGSGGTGASGIVIVTEYKSA